MSLVELFCDVDDFCQLYQRKINAKQLGASAGVWTCKQNGCGRSLTVPLPLPIAALNISKLKLEQRNNSSKSERPF